MLTGLEIVSLNEIAIREKIGRWDSGEFEVDLVRLRMRGVDTREKIVIGHLLPQVVSASKLDLVAVLRCSPRILRQRYAKRGYCKEKSDENVAAEVLDLVSYAALKKYGRRKVAEFDTTRVENPRNLARKVLATIEGKRPKLYGRVNWSRRAARSIVEFLETTREGNRGGIA